MRTQMKHLNEKYSKKKSCAFAETESLKEEEPNSYDCSNLARKRLFKAESEIQLLKSQITKEKVLWEGRFQELRRKQRELKEQVRHVFVKPA
ncbi:UNVERIFIED_CONTAM: hypothetical protein FKN15_077260 [Acipenser sinensis]